MADVRNFGYSCGKAVKALEIPGYFVWDCSVIKCDGQYHMFSSRWKKELGYGWNWIFNSEVIHSVSDTPEGPYQFQNVVLPRRDKRFFDGANTHNTCIKEYNGKFYLYYMGCTCGGKIPGIGDIVPLEYSYETYNRKRIGLAVADKIGGPFYRRDKPLLEPRDCSHWDCTITTNPAVAILPGGRTYMIYKSRRAIGYPLQLGVAVADRPDGEFTRLAEGPILNFDDPDLHIEDPFLWYDEKRQVFCILAKDDCKNGSTGITGEWGNGFYAESKDCIHFEIAKEPCVYTREIEWNDGRITKQANLERPSLLFDENGIPTHLFCASGDAEVPYDFHKETYIVCIKLE